MREAEFMLFGLGEKRNEDVDATFVDSTKIVLQPVIRAGTRDDGEGLAFGVDPVGAHLLYVASCCEKRGWSSARMREYTGELLIDAAIEGQHPQIDRLRPE